MAPRHLAAALFALLGIQNLALWHFLGWGPLPVGLGVLAIVAILVLTVRNRNWLSDERIGPAIIAGTFVCSLALFLLGGEGRLFYANTDWQVRGAVLRDLVAYPWPFAYDLPAEPYVLRLPIAMYLLPALTGKVAGFHAAEIAMLVQNSAMLTAVLSLGSLLFRTAGKRLFALAVFTLFSGMDVLGAWLGGKHLDVHLEGWAGIQYSAHVTQVFWVPQHALAGWIGAVLYLLWRDGKAPAAVFLAALPLVALTSPLALMGLVPFAAHAGLEGILRRRFGLADFALPTVALGLAMPGLFYLTSGSGAVGIGPSEITLGNYAALIVFEVLAFIVALRLARAARFGRLTSILVAAILLVAPWIQIGNSVDFVMRASIPALAILAVMIAAIFTEVAGLAEHRAAKLVAGLALIVGAVTPAGEIVRALRFPPSPVPLCNYIDVVPGGADTYVAPVGAMQGLLGQHDLALVAATGATDCWDGPWPPGESHGLWEAVPNVPASVYRPDDPTLLQ